MNSVEVIIISILIFIAAQTSLMTYRSYRGSRTRRTKPVFIDTSVLMDGRIVSIATSGFVPGHLVIPRSVIGELQFLADNADTEKRERARRGLDVAKELQTIDSSQVKILQDGSKAEEGVDERLLNLAKRYRGMICTIDFNLNKVAQVENIRVLNVNELAQQLRMSYLPGDRLNLELTTHGSDSHQAVGHLADGTMVVVEHAKSSIGKSVDIEIIRSLQTAAGRMMFAKLANQSNGETQNMTKKVSAPQGRKAAKKVTEKNLDQEKPAPKTFKDNRKQSKPVVKSSSSKRRPSSAQREASLVDLIDQQ